MPHITITFAHCYSNLPSQHEQVYEHASLLINSDFSLKNHLEIRQLYDLSLVALQPWSSFLFLLRFLAMCQYSWSPSTNCSLSVFECTSVHDPHTGASLNVSSILILALQYSLRNFVFFHPQDVPYSSSF